MELRQLRYLVAVLDARSITRASDVLHVVPSAVSQQLKLLEEELKCELLSRGPLGVQPTASGSVLYTQARVILRQIEDAKACVVRQDGLIAGGVSVAIAGSLAQALSVPLLAGCREQWPCVIPSIHEGLSSDLVEGVHSGRFDLGVLYASDSTNRLEAMEIVREPFFFGTTDPTAKSTLDPSRPMTLEELSHWPLLLPSVPNATRGALDRAFARDGIRYNIVGEVNSARTQLDAVLAGLGSSVFPWISTRDPVLEAGLLVIPLDTTRIFRDVVVVRNPRLPCTRAARMVEALATRLLHQIYASLLESVMNPCQ